MPNVEKDISVSKRPTQSGDGKQVRKRKRPHEDKKIPDNMKHMQPKLSCWGQRWGFVNQSSDGPSSGRRGQIDMHSVVSTDASLLSSPSPHAGSEKRHRNMGLSPDDVSEFDLQSTFYVPVGQSGYLSVGPNQMAGCATSDLYGNWLSTPSTPSTSPSEIPTSDDSVDEDAYENDVSGFGKPTSSVLAAPLPIGAPPFSRSYSSPGYFQPTYSVDNPPSIAYSASSGSDRRLFNSAYTPASAPAPPAHLSNHSGNGVPTSSLTVPFASNSGHFKVQNVPVHDAMQYHCEAPIQAPLLQSSPVCTFDYTPQSCAAYGVSDNSNSAATFDLSTHGSNYHNEAFAAATAHDGTYAYRLVNHTSETLNPGAQGSRAPYSQPTYPPPNHPPPNYLHSYVPASVNPDASPQVPRAINSRYPRPYANHVAPSSSAASQSLPQLNYRNRDGSGGYNPYFMQPNSSDNGNVGRPW